MVRFGHFHLKFPSKPKSTQSKLKITQKTHLIATNNTSNRIFPTQLRQKEIYGSSNTKVPNKGDVPNINSIPGFSSSSLLLFSSPTENPSFNAKNEIFLRPCLVLSKFDLTFPYYHLVLHFHLFSIQLIIFLL